MQSNLDSGRPSSVVYRLQRMAPWAHNVDGHVAQARAGMMSHRMKIGAKLIAGSVDALSAGQIYKANQTRGCAVKRTLYEPAIGNYERRTISAKTFVQIQ